MTMVTRLLLDTSSLMYRAFFALPTSITDGRRPVNAVRGYLDMTARLVASRRPDEVGHVLDDDWRPAGRVEAWGGYKSDRDAEPADLTPQFDLLREVLSVLGERVVYAPGWEADDAIGVLCAQALADDRVEVVTGDRDLLQLVRDDGPVVRVLYTVKGVSELVEFDESEVEARHGVPPARYVDYATLRGDPSDGLPGVKGVGEKTARGLVARYRSLDDLVADAAALTPRLSEQITAAQDYLVAMRAVVPVRTDVAITVDDGRPDPDAAAALAEARNLEGPIARLREARDA